MVSMLFESIVQSLHKVQEYKVQSKWGNDILKNLIESYSSNHETDKLRSMLKTKMQEID